MSQRTFKQQIFKLLAADNPDRAAEQIRALPRPATLKTLFSGLCSHDETVRWHAVDAMGLVVADLAHDDLEAARVVMRRFMWSLNDESGGIGWGVPEAMAECLARHEILAREYTHILVSFMRPDGFFLEYAPLQRGLMWGLGRLAQARPALLLDKDAVRYLLPYLDSPDGAVRGLGAWALGNLKAEEAANSLLKLTGSTHPVRLYEQGRIKTVTAGHLARQALENISTKK